MAVQAKLAAGNEDMATAAADWAAAVREPTVPAGAGEHFSLFRNLIFFSFLGLSSSLVWLGGPIRPIVPFAAHEGAGLTS